MMVLRPTLFPEPVAPATRRWGIFFRSVTKGFPKMSFPRAMVRGEGDALNLLEPMISRKYTASR